MSKIRFFREILCHLSVILGIMFAVFLILDQFNPMMNFVNNGISTWLLAAFCASAVGQSVLHWVIERS